MKHNFEKNLRIVNELMTYLHKLGSKDIHVTLQREESTTYFIVWGKINNIANDELESLKNILNTQRQHEVEEYYWHLGGECEADPELSLVGMMIDKADISYEDNTLTFKIYRNDF